MAGKKLHCTDLCGVCQIGKNVSVECAAKGRDSESIDPQICSFPWKAKARTRYQGSEELGLSKSNQQRTKVNKGNMVQDRERKSLRECEDGAYGGKPGQGI